MVYRYQDIGFDWPNVVSGLNESILVCRSIDKIRPATQEQIWAYLYAHGHKSGMDRNVISEDLQQSYIDESRQKRKKRELSLWLHLLRNRPKKLSFKKPKEEPPTTTGRMSKDRVYRPRRRDRRWSSAKRTRPQHRRRLFQGLMSQVPK